MGVPRFRGTHRYTDGVVGWGQINNSTRLLHLLAGLGIPAFLHELLRRLREPQDLDVQLFERCKENKKPRKICLDSPSVVEQLWSFVQISASALEWAFGH